MHLLSRRRRTEVLRSAKNVVILSEGGSFALRMIQRGRRTPCNLTSAPARAGSSPHGAVVEMPFFTSIFALRGKGSFNSVRNFASRSSYWAQDDMVGDSSPWLNQGL